MILYVDALDATFFPCHRDLLAEFHTFQADIVFQADDFDWRALRTAWRPPGAWLLARCPCSQQPAPVRAVRSLSMPCGHQSLNRRLRVLMSARASPGPTWRTT